jgi:hypothetical protein
MGLLDSISKGMESISKGIGGASDENSENSWRIIREVFTNNVDDSSTYTICYGYWMKSGLMSQTMFNFSVGYNVDNKEIVIVPIDSDGNYAGDILYFNKDNISNVKKTVKGEYEIKSSITDKPFRFFVPGFVPDSAEDTYQLPINQDDEAKEFMALMKDY